MKEGGDQRSWWGSCEKTGTYGVVVIIKPPPPLAKKAPWSPSPRLTHEIFNFAVPSGAESTPRRFAPPLSRGELVPHGAEYHTPSAFAVATARFYP